MAPKTAWERLSEGVLEARSGPLTPPPEIVPLKTGCHLHRPPIPVFHSSLARVMDSSAYRVWCPTCNHGVMLVRRHPTLGILLRYDYCCYCAQVFYYRDEKIANEVLHDEPVA